MFLNLQNMIKQKNWKKIKTIYSVIFIGYGKWIKREGDFSCLQKYL